MNFKYTLKPEGPLDARIAVVAEKGAVDEVREGRILVGTSGSRVRAHLAKAGVHAGNNRELSKEVWLTNAVQSFEDPRLNPTDSDIIREMPRLYRELCGLPKLTTIVGMGAPALKSLTNMQYGDITNRRGSRFASTFGIKLIPTFHPAYYMRGEWRFAPVVQFDINRAVEESQWTEIRHKYNRTWYIRPTNLVQALAWLDQVKQSASSSGWLSFDIETVRGARGTWYISCIALSTDPTVAYCLPLMHKDRTPYWPNISDECLIWRGLAEVLNLDRVRYVTQNGCAFDQWELERHGIKTTKMSTGFDTFSAHSLLAPDLPHDLGFLVSIYTDEEYYKDESGRSEYMSASAGEDLYWQYNCKDAALTLECAWGIMDDLKES